MTVADVLRVVAEHADLVEVLVQAIQAGASRDALRSAIADAMVQTSDAAMREELED